MTVTVLFVIMVVVAITVVMTFVIMVVNDVTVIVLFVVMIIMAVVVVEKLQHPIARQHTTQLERI